MIRKHINEVFEALAEIESYNPKQGGKIADLKKFILNSTEKID